MLREWYDQRCKKCPQCAFYRPEGPRKESTVDPDAIWPDACGRYGYSFHDNKPPSEDCDGFMTDLQLAEAAAQRKNLKKGRK